MVVPVVVDTTSILSRYQDFYSNLLNVHQRSILKASEIYIAEPDIPEPTLLEVELAIETLKKVPCRPDPIQNNSYIHYMKRYIKSCTHLKQGRFAPRNWKSPLLFQSIRKAKKNSLKHTPYAN